MNKILRSTLVVGGIAAAILLVLSLDSLVLGTRWWHGRGWIMPWSCRIVGFDGERFAPVFIILFWGLAIWGAVSLVSIKRHPSGPASGSSIPDSSIEILKKRYARGEIGKEEYEEKRNDIS